MNHLPESLRYILWRYSQDHQGEDHQQRYADAVHALAHYHLVSPDRLAAINVAVSALVVLADITGDDNSQPIATLNSLLEEAQP